MLRAQVGATPSRCRFAALGHLPKLLPATRGGAPGGAVRGFDSPAVPTSQPATKEYHP